ncbi:acetolactate synthase [Microtetraspora sp. NBRC 13810]|uniref:acetolactate synthase AlsS n=1 Tax=Microtetraspora sp. NBRC 13810 TaxID=3030990 RepID=UPI0024A20143|nr:acetolactate synthase AlsS [Microtetraspora sp. NBRC 13810]GLW06964.1 acetolactate synthase [Microtetraspora sp. NBRC 13810]
MHATETHPVRSAQRVIDELQARGVRYIFGVPGAKIDQVYDALADGGPRLVVCRHEQNAAFMAAAVGRLTGIPGVVLVTSGPGTANLATGLVTADTEGDPVLALCGAVPRAGRLKRTHQSMNAETLLAAVTKYTGEVDDPDNVPEAVANALRAAVTEPRGAAALILPSDVMAAPTAERIARPPAVGALGPAPAAGVERAARLIRSARRPALLAGARGAGPAASAAVRALLAGIPGLPLVETFQAAGLVSRELESHYLGRVGLFRNQPGDMVIGAADVVVTVGFDPVEYDPALWNAGAREIVHVDSIPAQIDNRYQPALELRGDVAATVGELDRALTGLTLNDEHRMEIAAQRQALAAIDDIAGSRDHGLTGMNPTALVLRLREELADDATVTCDVGSNYVYMARHFRAYRPRHLLFSNGQQTLGVALPWAIAATLVRPGTQVVSVSGDGGFLYSSMELDTAVRLGATFTHVIMRDNGYDMVGFQQLLKFGRKVGVELGDLDVVRYAEAFGAHGHRVRSSEEFVPTLRRALAEPGPSVVDVPVDYTHNTELYAHLSDDPFE